MRRKLCATVLGWIACVALIISACGDADGPTGAAPASSPEGTSDAVGTTAPTQTSVPIAQNPTFPPGEPMLYEITSHLDQPITPELLADFSNLVVIGVVREHLEPQWSTLDGSRPETVLNGDPTRSIFTPVVIDLEEPPLMDLDGLATDATSIVVLIEGCVIDDVTVRHSGSFYDFPVGHRVVLGALSTRDPFVVSIYGDALKHMLPEGYDVGWLPQVRFLFGESGVSSDGETYKVDEFFSRLDTAIEHRVVR